MKRGKLLFENVQLWRGAQSLFNSRRVYSLYSPHEILTGYELAG